ncbi:Hypothetical protein R9X50_00721400 [Acrodontium crateriforme]|uniref:Nudix hydrolase domain-containing protein n=1 Tax=Acrodontium crateriforme TaxID=150365 RepID=A0AAQ3MB08_9PEZI|nr:Hypothetical protein R9X50_00721400 [Acrodontium crateriforme]
MTPSLIEQTRDILTQLTSNPYPELSSPESTKRRASVAFIVRIQPAYTHWPNPSDPVPRDLASFFAQEWVQHGEPEILFIKRASRKGDRWTSHIALPGGKRDPEDVDDCAAAVREAWEEVGLDLNAHAIPAGNLPQRLVTTHWGKKPLMVLCPYVFLLTEPNPPALRLQPSEVAATHWVPLRALQAPEQRTVAFEDVSSRLANQETGVKKWMLRVILGQMMFAAIALVPSESLHSAETPAPESTPLQNNRYDQPTLSSRLTALTSRLARSDLLNQFPLQPKDGPLLLWGLTLGVVSDFLDFFPPHDALTLWTYPTFTPIDVRAWIWLLTYRYKDRKRAELQGGSSTVLRRPAFGGVTESLAATSRPHETGFHGLGTGSGIEGPAASRIDGLAANETTGPVANDRKIAAVATMLEGLVERTAGLFLPTITDRGRYYDIIRRAVGVALAARAGVGFVLAVLVYKRIQRRRGGGVN